MNDAEFCRAVAAQIEEGARSLPLRRFPNGDGDAVWALASDGWPAIRRRPQCADRLLAAERVVSAKVLPRYRSGWEGAGVWVQLPLLPGAAPETTAQALLTAMRARIECAPRPVAA